MIIFIMLWHFTSIYPDSNDLFYQVTSLPFLQGIKEEEIQTAVSFAWVMIFPLWIVLFFTGMALLEAFLRRFNS